MNTTATSFSSEHSSWLASRRGSMESVLSIQGKETDYVCDTSDTASVDDGEYEPVTEPEDEAPVNSDSSGDSDDIITTKVIEVTVGDDGDLVFADSEQTDSDGSDSELDLYDYWKCAQCHAKNNNPLYRYCEKCFKVRKNLFPPRPRPKLRCRTRTEVSPPPHTPPHVHALCDSAHTDSGVDTACTSQELSQYTDDNCHDSLGNKDTIVNNLDSNKNVDILDIREKEETNSIVDRRKRRAESVDRKLKRAKKDESDSEIERDRKRKSKSADPEVKPLTKTISDSALTIDELGKSQDDGMCIVCYSEPKSGVFVHGRIAHICCCYKCAVKVWSTAKRCPVCNCKVSNVLKAVVM